MFLLFILIVSTFAKRRIWSHRCRQPNLPENNLHACILASKRFEGIEVDVHWHAGHFWMHHDHWYKATTTLNELIRQNLSGGLWVDMKTSVLHSIPTLIHLLVNHTDVLVEVYDKKMIKPLQNANITVTSTHFDTPVRSIWMPRYILFSTFRPRFMSWHMDFLCLMDTFFSSGGELALTDLYSPPKKCSWSLSIGVVRAIAWTSISLIVVTGYLSIKYCIGKCMGRAEYSYTRVNQQA